MPVPVRGVRQHTQTATICRQLSLQPSTRILVLKYLQACLAKGANLPASRRALALSLGEEGVSVIKGAHGILQRLVAYEQISRWDFRVSVARADSGERASERANRAGGFLSSL